MSNWVIGVDPSGSKNKKGDFANVMGFAVMKDGQLSETGEVIPDPMEGFTRVRRWIRDKTKMICVRDESPKIVIACESAWYGKNVAVFAGLIRVKAHIESAVLDLGYSYREVSPLRSFQASTGYSKYNGTGTRKSDIRKAVLPRYGLSEDTSEHEVDAIAICEAILKEKHPV